MGGPNLQTTQRTALAMASSGAEPALAPLPSSTPAAWDQLQPVNRANSRPEVDVSSMRLLLDKLQLEVETSIRRYKQEMNRMLDVSRALEEDQQERPNTVSSNDPVLWRRSKSGWSQKAGLGRNSSNGHETESVTDDSGVDSEQSKRKSTWVDLVNQGSNIDSMVRELAAQTQPHKDCLQRMADFEVKAPQLISKDSMLRRFAASNSYTWIRGLFFVFDAIVIIAELQHDSVSIASDGSPSELPAYRWFSTIFLIYMWLEMTLSFTLEFPKIDVLFGRTGHRFINEAAIVQHTLAVAAAQAFPGQRYTSSLRIFVARFNFIRIFRTMVVLPGLGGTYLRQQLGELHIMIKALTGTVWPLFWCSVMYCIILVIFGVFFTEGAAASLVPDAVAADGTLVQDWIGLQNSVFSLSMAMLGGKDWGDLYDSLSPAGWVPKVGFLAFICFTHIALLNTVTAVFIKCAFMKFEHDREFIVQQEQQEKRDYLLSVKQIFLELDTDFSGCLNLEELVQHLKNPEVAAYFTRLGVDTDEVQSVFCLMDEDNSNTLSLEEFMWGCFRLRGSAKTLDLEILRRDVRFAVSMLLDMEASLKK